MLQNYRKRGEWGRNYLLPGCIAAIIVCCVAHLYVLFATELDEVSEKVTAWIRVSTNQFIMKVPLRGDTQRGIYYAETNRGEELSQYSKVHL